MSGILGSHILRALFQHGSIYAPMKVEASTDVPSITSDARRAAVFATGKWMQVARSLADSSELPLADGLRALMCLDIRRLSAEGIASS